MEGRPPSIQGGWLWQGLWMELEEQGGGGPAGRGFNFPWSWRTVRFQIVVACEGYPFQAKKGARLGGGGLLRPLYSIQDLSVSSTPHGRTPGRVKRKVRVQSTAVAVLALFFILSTHTHPPTLTHSLTHTHTHHTRPPSTHAHLVPCQEGLIRSSGTWARFASAHAQQPATKPCKLEATAQTRLQTMVGYIWGFPRIGVPYWGPL